MNQSELLLAGILSSLVLAACAPQGEMSAETAKAFQAKGDSIIGGTEVAATDKIIQSVVAVFDKTTNQLCTGSLLENNVVLTAAHCIGNGEMYIFFGPTLDPQAPRRLVDAVAISSYWETRRAEKQNTGDIALIHFQGTIPDGFKPATMLKDGKTLRKGRNIVIAGYGTNDGANGGGVGTLRTTTVKIADANFSVSEILLDQTEGKGACHGDSGGPAYVLVENEYVLWGLTSRGVNDPKNDCSQQSAYTNTLYYTAWMDRVKSKIAEFAKSRPPVLEIQKR